MMSKTQTSIAQSHNFHFQRTKTNTFCLFFLRVGEATHSQFYVFIFKTQQHRGQKNATVESKKHTNKKGQNSRFSHNTHPCLFFSSCSFQSQNHEKITNPDKKLLKKKTQKCIQKMSLLWWNGDDPGRLWEASSMGMSCKRLRSTWEDHISRCIDFGGFV